MSDGRCELCGDEWHGLSNEYGCPGAYATSTQRAMWDVETRRRLASTSVEDLLAVPFFGPMLNSMLSVLTGLTGGVGTFRNALELQQAIEEMQEQPK